ncbi:MAG: Crp/Fnr family transcriptional regulator [Anaerolineae bacterium]|nr:Crp/Fnr family transcriptional regulator [Anaerolineae bacterium]
MLTADDRHSILRHAALFAAVPIDLLSPLVAASRSQSVSKGDFLFRQGEDASTFYLLHSGQVRLVQHSAEGKDVTLATFGTGSVIALVAAITREPYPGSVEAIDTSELIALPGDHMWQLMNAYAPLAVNVLRQVAARLHEAHDRIRELSVEKVQQRVARSLLRLVRQVGVKQSDGSISLDLRLSRQDLAQMNGTTLETISRTLTTWERDGLIDAAREHLTVLKPHQLVVIAEDLPT